MFCVRSVVCGGPLAVCGEERERERELVGRTGDGLCAWSRVRGREERRESRAVKHGMERARTSVLTQFFKEPIRCTVYKSTLNPLLLALTASHASFAV